MVTNASHHVLWVECNCVELVSDVVDQLQPIRYQHCGQAKVKLYFNNYPRCRLLYNPLLKRGHNPTAKKRENIFGYQNDFCMLFGY